MIIQDFRTGAVGDHAETIPYRIGDSQGHMLRLTEGSTRPVSVPCSVQGPHRILLEFRGPSGIRLRLAGEPWYRWVETTVRWNGDRDLLEREFGHRVAGLMPSLEKALRFSD
ncbi:MAG: hypothetical protein VX528_15820 [Candidatus Latescibacterota bacterium]|nr:hypothetical protein [Candidatus Latescibacterota bacterium]